jgi:pimeloyl-ACP methyl ester carboxylesterase
MLPGTVLASGEWSGPRSGLVTLDGVGHFPHQEAPAATNRILKGFLSAIS